MNTIGQAGHTGSAESLNLCSTLRLKNLKSISNDQHIITHIIGHTYTVGMSEEDVGMSFFSFRSMTKRNYKDQQVTLPLAAYHFQHRQAFKHARSMMERHLTF